MRRSSKESDSDEDEFLTHLNEAKSFKSKINFENITSTDQINRKRNISRFAIKSDSFIPCKKRYVYNDNKDTNVANLDYVSNRKDSNNSIGTNYKTESNDTIDKTYPQKIGKFFNSVSNLCVVKDIKLDENLLHKTRKLFLKKRTFEKEEYLNPKKKQCRNESKLKDNFTNICEGKENITEKFINKSSQGENWKKPPILSLKRKSKILSDTNISDKSTSVSIVEIKKFKKSEELSEMSVYDRRYQTDERSTNCILSRVPTQHNDENINHITNQYYPPSTMASSNSVTNNSTTQPTIATLCNIGNTCYLNSVVYTLRFAPLFLHNLHHLIDDLSNVHQNIGKYRTKSSSLGRNINGLHMENVRSWSSKDLASLDTCTSMNNKNNSGTNFCDIQKSSQQIATEKLHELYQNLHKNEILDSTDPFHADTFLHAIQDVSSIFEGNQQQDAHEFLMCVLDNIRETCQSLIKSISECPDVISNGYVSLPEQIGTNVNNIGSLKDSLPANNHHSNTTVSSVTSQATSLIKTSFFSRKSKRKDEAKNSKNLRLQSPLKDNPQLSEFAMTSDNNDSNVKRSNINNGEKNNSSSKNIAENDTEISSKEKENRLAEKIKKLGLDFFTEDFEGITVSTTKCLSCETITEQKETMIDIAVPISGFESADFSGKSHLFIQNSCITREYFRGENKYRCEQCIGYTEAIRSISYEVLPRLLVIQLSRFSGGMEKINSFLPTPFTLQCFCSKCYNKTNDEDKLHVYKLYSVITHVGATMSVGHYIAYTCSLDWANEYTNCPKERQRQQQQFQQQQNQLNLVKSSQSGNIETNSNGTNGSNEKNIGLMKKRFFSRNKASSSGDMSKSVKNVNGVSSKVITNGVEKLKMSNNGASNNTICQSINCCGTKLKVMSSNILNNTISNSHGVNGSHSDQIDENINQNSNSAGGYNSIFNNNSTIYSGNCANSGVHSSNRNARAKAQIQEPIWYMCDDDKIKAMTQSEFEDLLSPDRKIMITPYLLFYARKTFNKECNSGNNIDNSDDVNVSGADE